MSEVVARRAVVHGHVQGVFFRASTRRQAQRHGLGGWVVNDADGTVTAYLEGPGDEVAAVLDWIRAGGPPAARVEHVEVSAHDPTGLTTFEVRHR